MDAVGPPPLTGRAPALAQLEGSFARLEAGLGTLLFVVGDAGIGKTRIAVEAVRAAASRGVAAGWGRSRPDGATPTLAPWAAALADAAVADLVALTEAAAGADRTAAFDEVVAQLRLAAPVLVVLDDLDAADEASLALLERVAGELPPLALVAVATLRPESVARRAPLGRLLRLVSDHPACDVLELEPLAVEAAIDCGADDGGARLAPERLIAVVARSGGNPFLIVELVRATAEGVETSLPRTAGEVLAGRLASLGPEARPALEALAVLGGEADLLTLSRLAGTTVDALHDDLGPALVAQLVEPSDALDPPACEQGDEPSRPAVRFAHALVRDAVMAGFAVGAEGEVHRRALDALRSAASLDPATKAEALAHHALSAALGGQPADPELVSLVVDAARWCLRRAGPENAAQLFARALATPAGAARRAELAVARAEALVATGAVLEARATFEDAASVGHDADLATRARRGILACVAAARGA